MKTNGESKFPYFLIGIGLGAIAGLLWAPRSGDDTRKYLRERTRKGLDTLNRQAGKLCESADGMVAKGKGLMGCHGRGSVTMDTETEKQTYQEEKRENMGG